jgi:CheY-like chemotaxis protein
VPAVVPTVLVVDGSEVERRALGTLLNGSSYRALVARSVDEAWRILETEPVKMVLCDLRLPEMHAQQLMDKIRRDGRFTQTPIVLILSHVGEQAQLVVQQLGVTDFVRSPVRREELLRVVGRLTEESSVR